MIERVSLSQGGKVTSVDPSTNTLVTDFGKHTVQVANVIPTTARWPHCRTCRGNRQIRLVLDRSGDIQIQAGFECSLSSAMPVSPGACRNPPFSANAQAKACAAAVVTLLAGDTPTPPKLINTCYSLAAPDYGISVAGVYQPKNGLLADIEGAGGTSPLDAPHEFREREALYARSWFDTITAEVFG